MVSIETLSETMMATLIVTLILTAASVSIATVDVTTDYGVYVGFIEATHGINVTKFLGIPYAEPPVDRRRFRKPEPLPHSETTVNCTRLRPACPGHAPGSRTSCAPEIADLHTSEDCLYLNVYVPGQVSENRTESLAVLVWIHGGSRDGGPGHLQDGSLLALAGDVIVVTFDFRQGILGFFSTEDSAGNWGLLDQVRALEWVRDSIGLFGGDPRRVTLFGQGSGARAVGLHILSPLSRGLFQRAISHSGTSTMLELNRHPLERVAKVAQYVNCSSEPETISSTTVTCFRAVAVRDILKADCSVSASVPPFTPTIDGDFLVGHPEKLMQAGTFAPVDYIVGIDIDEGSAALEAMTTYTEGNGINRTIFEKLLLRIYSSRFPQSRPAEVVWSALLSKYLPADDTPLVYTENYMEAYRDDFALRTLHFAKYHSRKGRCFVYYFPRGASTASDGKSDVDFVFGDIRGYGSTGEWRLSNDWMKAWASFAKSGNANFQNILWPVYNTSDGFYLDIAVNMTNANVKTRLMEAGQRLWYDVLPALITMTTNDRMSNPRAGIGSMTKERRRELEWGMTGSQLEELMLSLLITVTFLVVVCATLVRMICYVEHKSKSRKPAVCNGNTSYKFTANISNVGNYKPTVSGCPHKSAVIEDSTRL